MKDTSHREFFSILNNVDGALGNDRGVLLLVGPARDLRLLEAACFDRDQTWNSVVTARYTLAASAPEDVFGTLARKLIAEVSRWPSSIDNAYGTLHEFGPERLHQFPDPVTGWRDLDESGCQSMTVFSHHVMVLLGISSLHTPGSDVSLVCSTNLTKVL